MNNIRLIFFLAMILPALSYSQKNIPPRDIQIKTAILAAPEADRNGAMVYGYDEEGNLTVLREGTNNMVCLADDPDFEGISVACYPKKLDAFMARGRELAAQGLSEMEKRKVRKSEIESGKLDMPKEPSTLFVLSGSEENYDVKSGELKDAKFRYVIYIPYATPESTGLPLKPESPGMPWLMDPGTHRAHIMITPPD